MPDLAAASPAVALHSGSYVERYERKPLDRVLALAARMDVPDDANVADFACGNGMLAEALGRRSGTYHGVDFSPDFIAAAQRRAARSGLDTARFHCADIVAFCAAHPRTFDIAATLDFSEHVADDEAAAIYAAIRGTLRPGGTLYLHTPNLDFFLERAKAIGVLRQFPEHIAVRNDRQTRALLVRAGFAEDAVGIDFIPHYNVLRHLHPLSRLPLIGRWFRARLWLTARA